MTLTTFEIVQSIIGISILGFLLIFTCSYFCCKSMRDEQQVIYQRPSPLTLILYRDFINSIRDGKSLLNLDQIRSNLEKYNQVNMNHREEECVICLETIESNSRIYELKCKHYFHRTCLEMSCQLNNTCPICRDDLF